MYVCLAVTCHLHFWQNDRDLLRATAVDLTETSAAHVSLQLAGVALGAVEVGEHPAQGLRVAPQVLHGLLDLGGKVLGDGGQLGAAVALVVAGVAVGAQRPVAVHAVHGVDVVGVVALAALGQHPREVVPGVRALDSAGPSAAVLLAGVRVPAAGLERLHLVAGRLHLLVMGGGAGGAQVLLAVGAVDGGGHLPPPLLPAGGAVGRVARGAGQGRAGQPAGQHVVRQVPGVLGAHRRPALRAGEADLLLLLLLLRLPPVPLLLLLFPLLVVFRRRRRCWSAGGRGPGAAASCRRRGRRGRRSAGRAGAWGPGTPRCTGGS